MEAYLPERGRGEGGHSAEFAHCQNTARRVRQFFVDSQSLPHVIELRQVV